MSEKSNLKIQKILFLIVFNLLMAFIFIFPSPDDSPAGKKLAKLYKYIFKETVFMSCNYVPVKQKKFEFGIYGSVKEKEVFVPKEFCGRVKEGYVEIYNQRIYPSRKLFVNWEILKKFNDEFKGKQRIFQKTFYPSYKKTDNFSFI